MINHLFSHNFKYILILTVIISACSNNQGRKDLGSSQMTSKSDASPTTETSPSPVAIRKFPIATEDRITLSLVPDTLDKWIVTAPFIFDTTEAGRIGPYCVSSSGPCRCKYEWDEDNSNGPEKITIARSVLTSLTEVQEYNIKCQTPLDFVDIPKGVQVRFSVVSVSGTPLQSEPVRTLDRGGSTIGVSGREFEDILRYTCYTTFDMGLRLINQSFGLAGGFSSSLFMESSPNLRSAQSYFNTFYIRNSNKGNIIQTNTQFTCPKVSNPLQSGITSPFWPLDSQFSLAKNQDPQFSVEVKSRTTLSDKGSEINTNTIGWATRLETNGNCPTVKNSSGNEIQTHRLRRFVALYPNVYNSSGQLIRQAPIDSIYVIDRQYGNETRLGPKPCPFAWFDTKTNSYINTDAVTWDNHKPDGTEFPNLDIRSNQSCGATLPQFSYNFGNKSGSFKLVSVLKVGGNLSSLPVRPSHAFTPYYLEDRDFLACAPYPKNGIVDPPIIQSNSNAKYGYCAVTYPTQNGSYSHRAGSFTTNRTIVNINGDSAPFNKIPISVSRESAQISINQNLDLQFKLGLKNQDYLSSSYGCQIIDKDNPGQLKKETGSGKCCSTYPSSGYLEGGLNKCSP